MATPYTSEADATGDGWAKLTTTENGVTRLRYEKIIDGRVIEQSVTSTAAAAIAMEHWRADRVNKGKQS